MKSITSFRLNNPDLALFDNDIYTDGETFYIGLSFEQEPELGEGSTPNEISQYPIEDILDKYSVYIFDFCKDYNSRSTTKCKLVFASNDSDDIKALKAIIGKHVYNKEVRVDGVQGFELVIE